MSEEYIRCPECSFVIGSYAEFIEKAKHAYYKEELFENKNHSNITPDKMFFNNDLSPSIEFIFDAVGIKNRCCRMHLNNKTKILN